MWEIIKEAIAIAANIASIAALLKSLLTKRDK
jgi:hypothetical protein